MFWGTAYFIHEPILGHNSLTNLIMGAAPLHGMGAPYRDYWDIYPPGIYIIYGLLEFLFSGNILAYKLLHIGTVLAVCEMASGLVRTRIGNTIGSAADRIAYIFFSAITCLMLNSPHLNTIFFSNVLICVLISVAGLSFFIYSRSLFFCYGLSTFLFTFSGFVKDPFIFTAVLPALFIFREFKSKNRTIKALVWTFLGATAAVLINGAYLVKLNIAGSYLEVFKFKYDYFIKDKTVGAGEGKPLDFLSEYFEYTFYYSDVIIYLMFAVFGISIILALRQYSKNSRCSCDYLIYPAFFLLNYIGFKAQGRIIGTYCLQMTVPTVLVCCQIFVLFRKITFNVQFGSFVALLTLFAFLPQREVFASFFKQEFPAPREYYEGLRVKRAQAPEIYSPLLKQLLSEDKSMLALYGWGTPTYYYKFNVKPFSRFFVVHPNILGDHQLKEWVTAFKSKLPRVVMYLSDPQNADMDVELFERQTINIGKLLKDCYKNVDTKFYVLPAGKCALFDLDIGAYINPKYVNN
ncbi:MAG: hypothetical protein A2Z97_00675 [Bdellovibrionales bacterium GWB1_52_6]|nr:MAG: hypothetical protein A2Z97_00675 [Bdellovibrionales bacterium GWB1_52_6]